MKLKTLFKEVKERKISRITKQDEVKDGKGWKTYESIKGKVWTLLESFRVEEGQKWREGKFVEKWK